MTFPLYTITEKTEEVISELEKKKRVLIPTRSVIVQCISIIDSDNFTKLENYSNFTIYCLGNDLFQYVVCNDTQKHIINSIISKKLSITMKLPKSSYLPEFIKSDTVHISIVQDEWIRTIIHKLGFPIIAFNCNIDIKNKNSLHFTNLQQVLEKYYSSQIMIYNKLIENDSYVKFENSILSFNQENNIVIEKESSILQMDIERHLQVSTIKEVYPKNKLKNKKIFKLNFIEKSSFDYKEMNCLFSKEFKKTIQLYFQKCILIDFNRLNLSYENLCGAYVDLSEKGSYSEAIFNLYNVLHQSENLQEKIILISDFSDYEKNTVYNKLFWNKINTFIQDTINIPILQ